MKHTGPAKPWAQHAPVAGGVHEVELHAVFAPSQMPLPHAACVVTSHPTVPAEFVRQHAPVGGGGAHTVGLHATFACHTPGARQFACVRRSHTTAPAAVVRQHAPKTGHCTVLQEEFAPCHTPCIWTHWASGICWQGAIVNMPGSMQHAPVTGAHWLEVQVVPAPRHTAGAAHCACVVIVHVAEPASVRQHAPVVGAHPLLGHVEFAPSQSPAHCAWVVIVQPAIAALQHAPVGGVVVTHVVFVQVVPAPIHRPPAPRHCVSVITAHAAVPVGLFGRQHAPV